MMKWDQKYELGHEKIDAEHRDFFKLISDFQEAAVSPASRDELIRILDEIYKYANLHFSNEENIMRENLYPDQEQHSYLHHVLLLEVKNKLHQFRLGNIGANEVFKFLFEWFAFHTAKEDKKLAGHLGK